MIGKSTDRLNKRAPISVYTEYSLKKIKEKQGKPQRSKRVFKYCLAI